MRLTYKLQFDKLIPAICSSYLFTGHRLTFLPSPLIASAPDDKCKKRPGNLILQYNDFRYDRSHKYHQKLNLYLDMNQVNHNTKILNVTVEQRIGGNSDGIKEKKNNTRRTQ